MFGRRVIKLITRKSKPASMMTTTVKKHPHILHVSAVIFVAGAWVHAVTYSPVTKTNADGTKTTSHEGTGLGYALCAIAIICSL